MRMHLDQVLEFPFQGADMIDEQFAVQMIDFMLQYPGKRHLRENRMLDGIRIIEIEGPGPAPTRGEHTAEILASLDTE